MDRPLHLPKLVAYVCDGEGGAQSCDTGDIWQTPDSRRNAFSFVWVHMQRDDPGTATQLALSGLDHFVIEALCADETRPRCTVHGNGALINLRGVNLAPAAEPHDMVSARFWIEKNRVVGVWVRPLVAVRDMFDSIERGQAPVSPGDLVAKLALRLADRAEPTVSAMNEIIDTLEDIPIDGEAETDKIELAEVRRKAIVLRRYMFPQRDALSTLEIEDFDWLTERDRSRLREAADRVTRLGEELDMIRDRAQVIHDQIIERRSDRMNRQMLLLSIVAAIFLPLGLVTGLLGINVGGIPGTSNPWAFAIVCAILVAIAALQLWLFKRYRLWR